MTIINTTALKTLAHAKNAYEEARRRYNAALNRSWDEQEANRNMENILQFVLDHFEEDRDAIEWVAFYADPSSPLECRANEILRNLKTGERK